MKLYTCINFEPRNNSGCYYKDGTVCRHKEPHTKNDECGICATCKPFILPFKNELDKIYEDFT